MNNNQKLIQDKNCYHKNKYMLLLLMLGLFSSAVGTELKNNDDSNQPHQEISIPVRGNSWIINNLANTNDKITQAGLQNWSDPDTKIRTFFRVEQSGDVNIAIRAKVKSGQSKIKVTFGDTSKEIDLSNMKFENIQLGTFNIAKIGYHWLEMQGMDKSSEIFADVSDILISGAVTDDKVYFVKDDFYWGRRGPSVHLSYQQPDNVSDVLWFYNEITVPDGNDVLGSYFMANGFAEGYFGIQVNSPSERRILFSVWSPYKTDNPNEIPEDFRIKMLKKGEDVYTGKFGNEGSGGQSYRKYYWKTGITYRFLLKGQPAENNSTDYTAYFYAPEIGKWELIASFRRPKTNTHLKRLHSFLENFLTETGYKSRKALYSNQWVHDTSGNWYELLKARFTADATARKDSRLDYSGGVENGEFFLKNCGFFSKRTAIDTYFTRKQSSKIPNINFSELP